MVIAIIAILAAMLMPALESARDAARRVACASQLHQWYIGTTLYAGDYNDILPKATLNSRTYGLASRSPLRYFLRDYLKVPIPVGSSKYAGCEDYHNLAYCPAMDLVMKAGDHCWDHHIGYLTPGFNLFPGPPFGNARLTEVADGGRGYNAGHGPIALIMDCTNLDASMFPGGSSLVWAVGNNHHYSGGNVVSGAGDCKWVIREGWAEVYSYTGFAKPWDYYCYARYGFHTDPTDPYYGELAVNYPGVPRPQGLNHQPQMWPVNRRMFGYQ